MDNHVKGQPARTVYFDDGCEACNNAARKIKADIDLSVIGMSEEGARVIDKEALKRDVHAMDEHGVMYRGIDAVIVILRWHPAWFWLAPIIALPGIKQAAQLVYRIVAANRYRWFGRR